jgi:serine/threonine-protein kinase
MALTAGTRLGTYEILSILGAGGMGEVYRARDTKLNRDVALKILPDVFSGDADRLARFTREAETLAALNHLNIAHVYDAGRADATTAGAYLVMELVDGDDLSVHIQRGPMALGDAIPIARQIADALEAAHDQGIVHRDLKPANVKVRADGTVKVLDFGLAKALGPDPAGGSAGAMNSPTLTARATQMGMIIGTAAYMSPEQARGRAVDRRADVWAFGVVFYEMLSGRRAFEGDDVSITLASVLKEDVRWDALPADLPAPVRRLLRRCLEKDPKRRLSAIGDARLELDEATAGGNDRDATAGTVAPVAPAAVIPAWRRAFPWTVAAAGLAAALVVLAMWAPWQSAPTSSPRKLLAHIGAPASVQSNLGAGAIVSPDGTMLAFVGQQAGAVRLFVRKLDQLEAAPLAGTEDATNPFFSPNGEWVAFFAGGKLKKVAVTGGAALTLCDAAVGRGGTWTDDDDIVFTPNAGAKTALMRVSASGGKTAAAFGVLSEGATSQRWPQALPGRRGILYSENVTTGGWDTGNLLVAPIDGGPGKVVVRGGHYGRFVPSGPAAPNRADRADGHLLYVQQGTVFAVRFSLDRLETVGEARPALDGVASNAANGGAQPAFSNEGTLVYVPGTSAGTSNPIDWVARDGKTSLLRATGADWQQPRFSPDGARLAMAINDGKQRDIWVYDWARDAMSQLTIDPANDNNPTWSHDGRHIVFASTRAGGTAGNLYIANSDGTGAVTRLTESLNNQQPWSFHPSGKFIAFQETTGATGIDLMILPVEHDPARGWVAGKPTPFLQNPGTEVQPMFSPDGQWIAYFSNEAGSAMDVYVRPFPGPGGQWRVSTEGGLFPRWSRASNELVFLNLGRVLISPFTVAGGSFRHDKPRFWTETGYVPLGQSSPYDIHPDGRRLAIIAAKDQSGVLRDQIVVVSNFFDYLWQIAPGRK